MKVWCLNRLTTGPYGLSGEDRTPGLVIPNHALYQLSYTQILCGRGFSPRIGKIMYLLPSLSPIGYFTEPKQEDNDGLEPLSYPTSRYSVYLFRHRTFCIV